ncbi:DNA-packaging protein [Camelimonas abortus]|uniref:DNA-packaging protein n=1 Tax=Camelimonas abortus TaxID=1017184 RepID=A0ABV7LFB9_9HYPH
MTRCSDAGLLATFLGELPPAALARLAADWLLFARPDQLPPPGDWTIWLMIGGRGAGKTRAGAEWVRGMALGLPPFASAPCGRIALVGETYGDVRDVMVEGVSGVLSLGGADRPQWSPARRRLEWPNGAVAQAFSAEDPQGLRGPQFAAAWCDELCKWRNARETWDMLQFGLRLGERPRQLVTTTPRPMPLLRALLADPRAVVTRARTRDNAANLAPAFLEEVTARYAGLRLGRQELDGELIDDRPDALWSREVIEANRVSAAPPLARIVVAVDPPASSGQRAGRCGVVAAGVDEAGVCHVLEDATIARAAPAAWAERAIGVWRRREADALVVEVNQGGDMAAAVLRQCDPAAPVIPVRATRGKYLRAEPVAALTAQGRVKFCGCFPELEDELCDFGPGGLSGGRSPDRMDAMVWAVAALTGPQAAPRIRAL